MEKEFEKWYKQNERRFHCGHFDEKQIAYSAWIEGQNQALSMSGVSDSVPPVIYVEQGNSSLGKDLEGREYYIKHVSGTDR